MARIHARVQGEVQGVGYRAWCRSEAKHRGLRGWVRNRRDGSVEALFDGDDAVIDEMVAALWTGPMGGGITDVDTRPADGETVEAGDEPFAIRSTA